MGRGAPSSGFSGPDLVLVQRSVGRVVVVKQEHVDEVDEDTGGLLGVGRIIRAPLEDDHEHQVTEEAEDEDHLRDKLQDDVHVSPEISGQRKKIIKGNRDLFIDQSRAPPSIITVINDPYKWFSRPRMTPNTICVIPITTDIFIL